MRAWLATLAVAVLSIGPAHAEFFVEPYAEQSNALSNELKQIAKAHGLDRQEARAAIQNASAWFYLYRCAGLPEELPNINTLDLVNTAMSGYVDNRYVSAFLEFVGAMAAQTNGRTPPTPDFCRFARESAKGFDLSPEQ